MYILILVDEEAVVLLLLAPIERGTSHFHQVTGSPRSGAREYNGFGGGRMGGLGRRGKMGDDGWGEETDRQTTSPSLVLFQPQKKMRRGKRMYDNASTPPTYRPRPTTPRRRLGCRATISLHPWRQERHCHWCPTSQYLQVHPTYPTSSGLGLGVYYPRAVFPGSDRLGRRKIQDSRSLAGSLCRTPRDKDSVGCFLLTDLS